MFTERLLGSRHLHRALNSQKWTSCFAHTPGQQVCKSLLLQVERKRSGLAGAGGRLLSTVQLPSRELTHRAPGPSPGRSKAQPTPSARLHKQGYCITAPASINKTLPSKATETKFNSQHRSRCVYRNHSQHWGLRSYVKGSVCF